MSGGQTKDGGSSSLTFIDLNAAISDLDPSIADGFKLIFNKECPFEARTQTTAEGPQEVGTLEAMKVKILTLSGKNLQAIRIELSSETDLFFHFHYLIDELGFQKIQEKLAIDFPEFPAHLIQMFTACITDPQSHLGVFVQTKSGGRLDFLKNTENFRFVELFSCGFERLPEATARRYIAYRYDLCKSQLALTQARLQEIGNLVKLKNPAILQQLQKMQPSK